MKKLFATLLLALTPTLTLFSQDPIFTQAYSAGMYLNPALTGEQKGFKANLNYRNQWPLISGNYITNLYGVQKRIDSIGLGVGINILQDEQGQGTLNTTGIGLVISKWVKFSDKINLSWGVNTSFYQKTVDMSKLTFGDMIDSKLGFTNNASSDPNFNSTVSYINFTSGVLIQYKEGNTGFTYSNINTPNQSFYTGSSSRLPARLTLHNTTIYTISKILDWKIAHTIVLNKQQDFYSLSTYATSQFKWFKLCTGFSTMNAIIAGGGLCFPRFSINYTYETTISTLTNATGGAHEIGMSFRFGNKKEYGDKGSLSF